jgi:LuxR family quorum sensing-dependent transcriptional regulator
MGKAPAEFGSRAFEFVEDVQRLSTTAEVMDAMAVTLSGLVSNSFASTFFPIRRRILKMRCWPPDYQPSGSSCTSRSSTSALILLCATAKRWFVPYRWLEAPYDPQREPRAVEVVQRAMDFGLSGGIVIPIVSPERRKGHVWVGGQSPQLPESDMPALHLMALYAFDRVLSLHSAHPKQAATLTPREREVLTWVALGKSNWEIGMLLNISRRTVKQHITHCYEKLGAVTRAHAVMIALRDKIIQL